eukprot:GHVQ01015182.1.p1 GENE.GHVQ01015182.1~~GHVQ01015182.1.p1  ORF type:complete len:536 (+),score=64.21 GHVQ01015182.1:143-1750(+)
MSDSITSNKKEEEEEVATRHLSVPGTNGEKREDKSEGVHAMTYGEKRERKYTTYSDDFSGYVMPKRVEQHDELMEKYCSPLKLNETKLEEISKAFQDSLSNGLEAHLRHPNEWKEDECCFKMLDSCVPSLPTGSEQGVYYALDFGGTNFRSVRVSLKGSGEVSCEQAKFSLKYGGPKGTNKGLLDGRASATQLFDHFAERLRAVMESSGDIAEATKSPVGVGFTFSFPCHQTALGNAVLVQWTKGFETGRDTNDPVEGKDVGLLMSQAFTRKNVPATVSAVANDTVGTLLSCAYQKPAGTPPCLIGVILGTGMNAAYVEPNAKNYGYQGCIINTECGNFNRCLPTTEIDVQIDWETTNKGFQLMEKMMSGAYLGEIVRLIVLRIFRYHAPPMCWTTESFTCEDASVLLNDVAPDLRQSHCTLRNKWEINFSHEDVIHIKQICCAVFERSTALAAAMICAMCNQTGQLHKDSNGITVGVDGSLYVKNEWYASKMRHYIKVIVGEAMASKIYLLAASDGSGQGAAILAAASRDAGQS